MAINDEVAHGRPGPIATTNSSPLRGPAFLESFFSWEVVAFMMICVTDLCTTLVWTWHGFATESNPILGPLLRISPWLFAAFKIASFVPALVICSYYRRTHPKLVAWSLRAAIVVYLAVYAILVGRQLFYS